jgi:multiple sugar transport system substrate-binding protein
MVWCGTFILSEFRNQTDLDYGAAEMPQLGPQQGTWAGSHMLCLRSGLTDQERAASEKFVRYLSDHSLDWADAGQVPVRKKLRDDPRFQAMPVQSTFARQIPYAKPMPSTTFTREYQAAWDPAVESVLRGDRSAADALKEAATAIRLAASRFAPPAAGGGAA